MSDKVFVGRRCATVSKPPALDPISKIVLWVDSENCYEAGDNSGREFEITCPYGSQKMADDLLRKLGGYAYKPLEATDALIDPAAELGDAVTVAGRQTILASMSLNFDSLLTADISAPGAAELKPEYTFTGAEKLLNRKIARTNTRISKTSEAIRLEVFGEGGYTGASVHTLISAAIGNIRLEVSGEDGTTSFKLTDGTAEISSQTLELKVNAVNIYGQLTAKQIDASELKVDAANITGTLIIGQQLPSNLATTSDIPSATDITLITNNAIQTGTIRVNSLYGENIYLKYPAGNDFFGNPVYGNAGIITVSNASTADYAFDLTSYGAMRLTTNSGDIYLGARGSVTLSGSSGASCIGNFMPGGSNDGVFSLGTSWSRWSTVYAASSEIVTSDRNKKHSIDYDLTRYENLFGRLLPAVYKFNDGTSDRYHIGFISQDVEEGLTESDMTSLDFAGFIKSPKKIEGEYDYALRYEEFIALNTYMIQKLMARVDELERRQTA